ncbi:mannitol-1-phosphate 5-dehydrogenase [Sutcliffiella halmapala]|uniref:mannitol-1-phosphate 5-dehydrogenase n=1 Tax=Sutcliffiella halmapala TaxID=79882 RepID=UPI00099511D5|nr:mannitol-1-phosphate 5-dehydrogenase [Sutcliffiella halmapala]
MLAVHFGAGNIGRGFIGALLYQSGYHTTFVDVNKEVVDLLNEKKEYRVVLADRTKDELTVGNVAAINSATEPERLVEAIVNADLVTTAVGPAILPIIAKALVQGLRKRLAVNPQPLNIIACENLIGGSTLLKKSVYELISEQEIASFDEYFAFPDAAVDRIVPNQSNEDKLMVIVEPYYEWVVDESKVVGITPSIKGITFVEDLTPYIERKLFTVNTGHAITAYIGYQLGFPTINEALEDAEVRRLVEQALNESGALLVKKYGFNLEDHQEYIQKILKRFLNPYITDEVTRVGRAPMRKLGANDRLIAPARQYLDLMGETPTYLAKGIVAALKYDAKQDEEAIEIQQLIQEKGLNEAIQELTGLGEDSDLIRIVVEEYGSNWTTEAS